MKKINNLILNNESYAGWIFILPALLGCIIFILVPIIVSLYLSFTSWNMLSVPKIIGLENYKELIFSPEFWLIFQNTIVFGLATTVFGTIIPLLLASVINSKIAASNFFKTSYFVPFITPMIVIAMIWEWIFDPNIGIMNYILKLNINWIHDSSFALLAIIIVSVWKLVGYNMIILLSGFALINNELYESAKIDGATGSAAFFRITLPLLSPTIFFVLLVTTISSFQVFDLIFLMTSGGPENSTNVLVYWLYKNAFEYFNIGKASAIAYILFIFIALLTFSQWIIRKKWVYNE